MLNKQALMQRKQMMSQQQPLNSNNIRNLTPQEQMGRGNNTMNLNLPNDPSTQNRQSMKMSANPYENYLNNI